MASPNVTYEEVVAGGPDAIVRAIAASRARARLNFRLIFVVTWLILVGGLVIAIASTGRVDPAFLAIWAPLHPVRHPDHDRRLGVLDRLRHAVRDRRRPRPAVAERRRSTPSRRSTSRSSAARR